MNKILLFFLFYILIPTIGSTQTADTYLGFGIHGGLFLHTSKSSTYYEPGSLIEGEFLFNFDKSFGLAFNYDISSSRTKYPVANYVSYLEQFHELSVGPRFTFLNSKIKLFSEIQFGLFSTINPEDRIEGAGFGLDMNLSVGAKYTIIKEIDIFSKVKCHNPFNCSLYAFTAGFNVNLFYHLKEKNNL
jgi:hypothetical protein